MPNSGRSATALAIGVFHLLAAGAPSGDDWSQWRGPHRDGAVVSFTAPPSWPETLQRKWKLAVGEGYASPVFAGGRIFVFTRQQDEEVLSAVDPQQGKLLWRAAYPAPYQVNPAASKHGPGPKATPAVQDGRVFTLGISGILSCFDAATGTLRWRKDFSRDFKETAPWYGTASSPMPDRSLLIANVGGNDEGALMAFDAASGAVRWTWKGDGPGYASPVAAELAGVRQVITQTQQNIVGLAEATGELLWKIPFSTEFEQNSVTPLVVSDTVILSGINKGTMAVRVAKKDGKWVTDTVWHNKEASMYMNSPVVAGDRILGFTHRNKGQIFCLDAHSGATLWTGPPRQGDNAAALVAGSLLFVLKDDAELLLAQAGAPSFTPLRQYTVADSSTWAHPLVLARGIVIKDTTTLALWGF